MLATFIGICATIIVGFQIASFVKIHETERQIKELQQERIRIQAQNEQLQNEIKKENEQLKNVSTYLGEDLSNVLVIIAKESTNNLVKIVAYMMSIYCCEMETVDKKVILLRYRCLRDSLEEANTNDIQSAAEQIYRLKDIIIPQNITYYTEIMKLHLECIEILEKVKQDN